MGLRSVMYCLLYVKRRPNSLSAASRGIAATAAKAKGISSSMSPRFCGKALVALAGVGGAVDTATGSGSGVDTPGVKKSQPISSKTGHVVHPPALFSNDHVFNKSVGLL